MSTISVTNLKNAASASSNLVMDASGNTTAAGTVAMGSSFLRNRIINGAMVVDQRNVGASVTLSTGVNTYIVDRWIVACNGASITAQRTGTVGAYGLTLTGAAGATVVRYRQRIESTNIADLASSPVTLSFTISSSTVTSVDVQFGVASTQDNFSPTTYGSTSSVAITSTPTRYSVTQTLAASAVNGVEVMFTMSNGLPSGTVTLTDVQLEAGTVATSFERRLITQEIQFCQRYYQKSYSINVALGTSSVGGYATSNGLAGGTGNTRSNIRFPTEMRSAPTLSYWDLVGNASKSSAFFSNNSQNNNITSASFSLTGIGTSGFAYNDAGGVGSAGSGAWVSAAHWAGTSEL